MTSRQKRILTFLGLSNVLVFCILVPAAFYLQSLPARPDPPPPLTSTAVLKAQLQVTPVFVASTVRAVAAQGKVVPARYAALSFPDPGLVTEVLVKVGDRVDTSQVLARLDTRPLEMQLARAEADLASAQAEANSATAQADADLAIARAKLNQLRRGPREEDLSAARQAIKSAQAAYDALLKPADNEVILLKADMDKTKAQVDRAQAAYDKIGGDSNPNSGMTPERANLQMAWVEYQKALALYNLKTNPTDAQIQQALAGLQTAKDNLAKLSPTAEDIAVAEANVNAAKTIRDQLPSQAHINAAKVARDIATENLNRASLMAPYAGTVVAMDLRVGEHVPAGIPVMYVADTAVMQIETTDLTELDVVKVKEGDRVTVTLDAIPGLELNGNVANIKSLGQAQQGDLLYTIAVKLNQQDARLRWNMTAKVNFAPK
jgi:HlyD family secretion protein